MATYDEAVRKRINTRWDKYKKEVGTNQTKAAKALGMNQSAFGQYLRGEIPLNTEFVQKFADLTDTSFEDLKIKVTRKVSVITLEVRATLSGRKLQGKRTAVSTLVPLDNCYLVEVDFHNHFMPKGSFVVVSTVEPCREGDTVLLGKNLEYVVLGQLNDDESGWSVIEQHFFGARNHTIGSGDELHRVVGFYLPERTGREFKP